MNNNILKKSFSKKPIHSLAIAAHFDDVEFMAYSAISECIQSEDKGFAAVVLTNGGGSPRGGKYADITDADMIKLRVKEQFKAAEIGEYSEMICLMQSSQNVKSLEPEISSNLAKIILELRPKILYCHNPFDKHPTHIASCKLVVDTLRSVRYNVPDLKVVGCEVWRGLDWVADNDKIGMDTSYRHDLARQLFDVFDSQITGGKNYGNATIGRYVSNATFFQSHSIDTSNSLSYGIDMTPLLKDENLTLKEFATQHLDNFRQSVLDGL